MDIEIIKRAGLTDSQAKAYITLIEHKDLSPAELAEHINESRTNTYAIIDKLLKYGLISKKSDVKYGAKYNANHPSCLEELAERRRKVYMQNEKVIENNMNGLIEYFFKFSEEPGARTLQGTEGIKKVYEDTLKEARDIYLVRTRADTPSLGEEFYSKYRRLRVEKNIHTYSLTPYSPEGVKHVKDGFDASNLYTRIFLPKDTYTAPVEIDIYGDKVAFIAFGETQMATIIDSPAIALALGQIHSILSTQLKEQTQKIIQDIKDKS